MGRHKLTIDYDAVQDAEMKRSRELLGAVAAYIEDGKPLPKHPQRDPLRLTLAEALQEAMERTVNASVAASQIECRKRHGEHTHDERAEVRFAG